MKKLSKLILSFSLLLALSIILSSCSSNSKEYSIGINVPPGTDGEVYSDAEFIATANEIIVSAGENLPETDVILIPIEAKTETAYEPVRIRTDVPYKIKVEKGAKFKIAVSVQNDCRKNMVVYVNLRNIERATPNK